MSVEVPDFSKDSPVVLALDRVTKLPMTPIGIRVAFWALDQPIGDTFAAAEIQHTLEYAKVSILRVLGRFGTLDMVREHPRSQWSRTFARRPSGLWALYQDLREEVNQNFDKYIDSRVRIDTGNK